MKKPKSGNNPKKKGNVFKYIIITIIIALIIRIFIFEVYMVPSSSMADTILPGELILVNKLAYGARLKVNSENDKETRMPGFSKIKHNDVIVFNFPEGDTIYKNRPDLNFYDYAGWQSRWKAVHDTIEHGSLVYQPVKFRQPYVKRCIGMPGDTVRFFNNAVFVNNQNIKDPVHFWAATKDSLSENAIHYLKSKFYPAKKDLFSYNYFFPHYTEERWNNECYGPLYIPGKGNTVNINYKNISLYYRIITAYEYNKLDTLQGKIYINGSLTETYTFKQNYYFMIGDNYFGSIDSRFWGFVPENHIIGKAVAIVWSWDENKPVWLKFRIERMFNSI